MAFFSPAGDGQEPSSPAARTLTARWQGAPSFAFSFLVWLYLALLLAFWLVLYFFGDRWWPATVALFGPRWVCGLPLAVLVPAAAVCRRRLLWPLAASALVVVGPIGGFCIPWARLAAADGPTVRVLTCNIDGPSVHEAALRALVRQTNPDVVMLQEFSNTAEWLRGVLPKGFHIVQDGELVLASHFPMREVSRRFPHNDGLCCELDTPFGAIHVCCLHLFTPRRGLSIVLDRQTVVAPSRRATLQEVTETRRNESQELTAWIAALPRPMLVAGDFNMPADSCIYRGYWSAFGNAFSQAGLGFGGTKITPLGCTSYGLRIDHVLLGPQWQAVRAWVGPDVGSDHLPLLADLAWKP